jgi:tetratricopeptide (TPR) repeat protein
MAQIAELDDRIAKCNKILEENPNSQIFAALAEAYRKKGEVDKAFRTCQNGLRIHPNYGSAHMVMAKINLDKGLYDWAEMEVLKTIELDGNSHSEDLLLAEIYIYKGEFAKAAKILNRLYNTDPGNPHVNKLLEIVRKMPLDSSQRIEVAPKMERVAVSEKPPEAKVSEKISLKVFLDNLAALTGVEGVLLINKEGLVAEARWDDPQPADLYGAVIGDIERTIQSQIEISHFGDYENILLEAGDLIINLMPMKGNLLLIKTSKQINLGTLRMRLSGLLARLTDDYHLS